MAAALDLDHGVVATFSVGHLEGHRDLGQVDGVAEVLLEGAAVDDDLALTCKQAHPGDARLAPARAVEERSSTGSHQRVEPPVGSGSGCCASCGCSVPA